ncbi:hypothetical protein I4U23_019096 [Adineta vaga]|nr:hypothetical protein I4U23_019096 [Adineta vaga]
MDDFDLLNQPVQVETVADDQEDDLFGSGTVNNSTEPTNTSTNNQQDDFSWQIENVGDNVTDTKTSQSNALNDDTLNQSTSTSETTSFNDDVFANQANTNQLDSYSPATDDSFSNEQTTQQSGQNTNQSNYTGISFTETSSPLHEYNTRRQQEIAEKDVEEKRKNDELRKQAQADLDRWYQERKTHMEQKRQAMKNEEEVFRTKALEKSDNKSCDWSKVVRLLDFSQGSQLTKGKRDLNQMKSTLLQATRQKIKRASENGI